MAGEENNNQEQQIIKPDDNQNVLSQQILNWAKKTIDETKETVDDKIDSAKEVFNNVKETVGNKIDTAQNNVWDLAQKGKIIALEKYNLAKNYLEKYNFFSDKKSEWEKIVITETRDKLKFLSMWLNEWKINVSTKNDLLDDLKYKEREKETIKNLKNLDIEKASLNFLTWKETWPKAKQIALRLFKDIPLKDILEVHEKASGYNNIADIKESFTDDASNIIKEDVSDKFRWKILGTGRKPSKELIALKKIIWQKITMRSMWFIGEFLWINKWIGFNEKYDKTVWDLLDKKEFKKFIEFKQSFLKENVSFYEFKNNQIKWLREKLSEPNLKADLFTPWLSYDVDYWNGVVEKSIVFKWDNFPEDKRWFYIGWYKYKIDWIKNITNIWIDWDNIIIKWKIHWQPNSEIKLSKTSFAEWLSDLVFKWYRNVSTTDLKKEVTIQRDL